jgi:SulP family sulfate permease
MSAAQVLAACGATAALACAFQWLFGAMHLASLARFLPISVMHGFAAGVGLSMVVGQLRTGFGAGAWTFDARLARSRRRRARGGGRGLAGPAPLAAVPGLLPGVAGLTVVLWLGGWAAGMQPAAQPSLFQLPPVPDHAGVPWQALLQAHGVQLVSLALLMAVVNSLDVLVFNQEMELEHGLRREPNRGAAPRERGRRALRAVRPDPGVDQRLALAHHAGPGRRQPGRRPDARAAAGRRRRHRPLVAALVADGLPGRRAAAGRHDAGAGRDVVARLCPRGAGLLEPELAGGAGVLRLRRGGALVAGLVVATFVLLHASAASVIRRPTWTAGALAAAAPGRFGGVAGDAHEPDRHHRAAGRDVVRRGGVRGGAAARAARAAPRMACWSAFLQTLPGRTPRRAPSPKWATSP